MRRGGISLEDARAAIERGGVFAGGKREKDPRAIVRAGALVEAALRERGGAPAAPAPLGAERILFLDPHLLAVDKPAGVLAQEGRAGGPSLCDLAAALLASRGEKPAALLVHRLDRGTTGVTLLARTPVAQAALLAEFRAGRVEKEYRALVAGAPPDEGAIDLALGPDPRTPGGRRPDPRGEAARTRYRVLERYAGAALVAAFPETGRTHQVRVHLAAIGHPLLGDVRYRGPRTVAAGAAPVAAERPLLHSLQLRAAHPGGGRLEVTAPLPADFSAACEALRAAGGPPAGG